MSPFPLVPRGPLEPLCSHLAQRGRSVRASVHTQLLPRIMIVNRLEANKERFRPEGFDQIRPHSIRSLQIEQKFRPLSFRPKKIDLFKATTSKSCQLVDRRANDRAFYRDA